jgi:hypothetical protein
MIHFALTKEQRAFYALHGWIEFADLLGAKELIHCQTALSKAGEGKFAGRDSWRESAELHKIVARRPFGSIAHELTHTAPLRLGFTQFLHSSLPFPQSANLDTFSSLTAPVCGILFCLKEGDGHHPPIFSSTPGHGVFFHPQTPIPFDWLKEHPKCAYLLFAYVEQVSLYKLNPFDPATHYLKKLGYVFGDRVRDNTHPVIYR